MGRRDLDGGGGAGGTWMGWHRTTSWKRSQQMLLVKEEKGKGRGSEWQEELPSVQASWNMLPALDSSAQNYKRDATIISIPLSKYEIDVHFQPGL